jgi:hypothetical protein
MAAEGVVLRDLIDDPGAQTTVHESFESTRTHQSGGVHHGSTAAHAHEPGPAQTGHAEEVDLGWDTKPEGISNPLIAGLDNEDLWTLIRRFNKVGCHFSPKMT